MILLALNFSFYGALPPSSNRLNLSSGSFAVDSRSFIKIKRFYKLILSKIKDIFKLLSVLFIGVILRFYLKIKGFFILIKRNPRIGYSIIKMTIPTRVLINKPENISLNLSLWLFFLKISFIIKYLTIV